MVEAVCVLSRIGTRAKRVSTERVIACKSTMNERVATCHLSVLVNNPWVPYGVTVDRLTRTAELFSTITAKLLCVETQTTIETSALWPACSGSNTVDKRRAGRVPCDASRI